MLLFILLHMATVWLSFFCGTQK